MFTLNCLESLLPAASSDISTANSAVNNISVELLFALKTLLSIILVLHFITTPLKNIFYF